MAGGMAAGHHQAECKVNQSGQHPRRDMAEVGALALELSGVLFGRALRLTGDWCEADDLVQEAFTAALTNWDKISGRPRDQQLGWLNRVMINKKIDRWRTAGKRSIPVAEVPEIRTAASSEEVALVRHALDRCDAVIKAMPPERRKAAFLRWYCRWTAREIADWSGIAESTVRGHLMWALRRLNEEARPELPFIDDLIEDDEFPGRQEEA